MYIFSLESIPSFTCDACQLDKHHVSFLVLVPNATSFALIQYNIWDLSLVDYRTSYNYLGTFIDSYSHMTLLYLLKNGIGVLMSLMV